MRSERDTSSAIPSPSSTEAPESEATEAADTAADSATDSAAGAQAPVSDTESSGMDDSEAAETAPDMDAVPQSGDSPSEAEAGASTQGSNDAGAGDTGFDTAAMPAIDASEKPQKTVELRGKHFGPYEILEEISRGSMGIVYSARDTRLQRIVALKVLIAGEHASWRQIRRFQREAEAVAQLRHPNIVPIHEIGEHDGKHFFTMDFIEGVPLSQLLRDGALPPGRCLDIIEEVCDAVQAAHDAGVIHRDIKPSNIMIDRHNRVQIMDFGLAKQTDRESHYTQSGTTIGTPAYMPPEQARGELQEIGPRSDVYSIGAVLYEMFTGHAPFGGNSVLEVILQVIHDDPVPPRKRNPKLSRDVQTIIEKAMDKNALRRYRSARAMADDIRRFRSGEAIRARPMSIMGRLWRRVRMHRAVVFSALLLLVVAGASASIIYTLYQRLQQQQQQAQNTGPVTAPKTYESRWQTVFTSNPQDDAAAAREWEISASLDGTETEYHIERPDPFYGSVRLNTSLTIAQGAEDPVFGCAMVGSEEPLRLLVTCGNGRLTVTGWAGLDNPDAARRVRYDELRVLAQQKLPVLEPGAYTFVVERHNMELRVALRGADGAVHEQLTYRDLHLTNWRLKNVGIVLRGTADSVQYGATTVSQHLAANAGPLQNADDRFYRGDYNGAQSTYHNTIRDTSVDVGTRIEAHHRLGLYNEIKARPADALNHYERALKMYRELLAEAEWSGREIVYQREDLDKAAAECQLRRLFCLVKIGADRSNINAVLEEYQGGLPDGAWVWHYPELVVRLSGEDLDLALRVHRLSPHPPAYRHVARAAVRLAGASRDEGRLDIVMDVVRIGPHSAELAASVSTAVKLARDQSRLTDALRLLQAAAPFFADNDRLISEANDVMMQHLIPERRFREVTELHQLYPADSLTQALAAAASNAALEREIEPALDVLKYAWPRVRQNRALTSTAKGLARQLISMDRHQDLIRLYQYYPHGDLSREFTRAVEQLQQRDPAPHEQILQLLTFARDYFPKHRDDLARKAASYGEELVQTPALDPTGKQLQELQVAYPTPRHLGNFLAQLDYQIEFGLYMNALDLYAFSREHLQPHRDLLARGVVLVEREGTREFRSKFRRRLRDLALNSRGPARYGLFLEIGDHLLASGDWMSARRQYVQVLQEIRDLERLAMEGAVAEQDEQGLKRVKLDLFQRIGLVATMMGDENAEWYWNDIILITNESDGLYHVAQYMLGKATADEVEVWKRKNRHALHDRLWKVVKRIRKWRQAPPEERTSLEQTMARMRLSSDFRLPYWPYHLLRALHARPRTAPLVPAGELESD